jgi:hypothetical protein
MLAVAGLGSSVEANVIGGLVVALFVAILGIGVGMLRGQRRTHEALFGFTEGDTTVPGIITIVKGNGHGSLLQVCEEALSAAKANGEALDAHVTEDNRRWDEIQEGIEGLKQTAIEVHDELHDSPAPVKKAAARKRAAPRKAAAAK